MVRDGHPTLHLSPTPIAVSGCVSGASKLPGTLHPEVHVQVKFLVDPEGSCPTTQVLSGLPALGYSNRRFRKVNL